MAFEFGLRRLAAIGAAASVLALAACGGGDTVVPFAPTRMVAFGDELSVLEADGRKYTVNALTAATATPPLAIDCVTHPLWIQIVAKGFSMAFPQCPEGTLKPLAETRASAGARVADLKLLVDDFLASGAPKDQDLVTMLIGMHDVLDAYAAFKAGTRTKAEALADVDAAGKLLAEQVNRVANAGPAVVVSTAPDMGKTPLAVAAGTADAALLTELTTELNGALRVNMVQDGRLVGIVFADAEVSNAVKFPGSHGYINVTDASCPSDITDLRDCDTSDLSRTPPVNGNAAAPLTWLWADATRPGPNFHLRLGQLAQARALNNPF